MWHLCLALALVCYDTHEESVTSNPNFSKADLMRTVNLIRISIRGCKPDINDLMS